MPQAPLSADEAALLLGLSRGRVYQLVHEGRIKAAYRGKPPIRIWLRDLQGFMTREGRQRASPRKPGRPRKWSSEAERLRAYRACKRAEVQVEAAEPARATQVAR